MCFKIGFVSLVALQLTILIQWATEHEARPTAAIPSAITSLLATVVLGALSFFHQRTSAAPSIFVEGSLFFSTLFEAVQVRSYWLRSSHLKSLAITTSISLATRTSTLLVEAQPQRRQSHGSSRNSVELAYGFLGQVSFWWLNPPFLTAWKAAIPMNSLWSVDAALSSSTLAENFSALKTGSRTSIIHLESYILYDF
jgi:ATP-binding cassette subfamily C (CFTR/MRP) protein 1